MDATLATLSDRPPRWLVSWTEAGWWLLCTQQQARQPIGCCWFGIAWRWWLRGPLGPVEEGEHGYTPTRQPTTAAPGPGALGAKAPVDEATPSSLALRQPLHHCTHPPCWGACWYVLLTLIVEPGWTTSTCASLSSRLPAGGILLLCCLLGVINSARGGRWFSICLKFSWIKQWRSTKITWTASLRLYFLITYHNTDARTWSCWFLTNQWEITVLATVLYVMRKSNKYVSRESYWCFQLSSFVNVIELTPIVLFTTKRLCQKLFFTFVTSP